MPYEMSRDFSHPVSFHVMLSVSVAAPLFPHADVNETYKRTVVADRDRPTLTVFATSVVK